MLPIPSTPFTDVALVLCAAFFVLGIGAPQPVLEISRPDATTRVFCCLSPAALVRVDETGLATARDGATDIERYLRSAFWFERCNSHGLVVVLDPESPLSSFTDIVNLARLVEPEVEISVGLE
jgi:biopolymer transport protein ExbD